MTFKLTGLINQPFVQHQIFGNPSKATGNSKTVLYHWSVWPSTTSVTLRTILTLKETKGGINKSNIANYLAARKVRTKIDREYHF